MEREAAPTSREYVVLDENLLRPAGTLNPRMPHLIHWPALDPLDRPVDSKNDIDRYDNEPDNSRDPAIRDAQQRDRKRCFAPRGTDDESKTGSV